MGCLTLKILAGRRAVQVVTRFIAGVAAFLAFVQWGYAKPRID